MNAVHDTHEQMTDLKHSNCAEGALQENSNMKYSQHNSEENSCIFRLN